MGTGYDRYHFVMEASGRPHLIVNAGSADLPTLRYKAVLYKGCYTESYFYETLQHGTFFFTDDEVSPSNGVAKEFIRGIVEGLSWQTIQGLPETLRGHIPTFNNVVDR